MTEIENNTKKLLEFIGKKYESSELDNSSLVEIIKLSGDYLGLKTISDYAKQYNMSYEGVKKCRANQTFFNVKFVIDNE